MKFRAVFVTNVGRGRKNNEDSLLAHTTLLNRTSLDAIQELNVDADHANFIVADGMGGEEAGEEASGEALKFLAERLSGLGKPEDLVELLKGAKRRLDDVALRLQVRLGTTMAGLIFGPALNLAYNIGDCRVYKLSGGYLNRLTRDHSLLEEATAAGMDTAKVPKNVVTSALMGGDKDELQVFTRPVQPKPNDLFLVCSDGLWGILSDEAMEEAFKRKNLPEIGAALLEAALPKSDDNVSFLLVQVLP